MADTDDSIAAPWEAMPLLQTLKRLQTQADAPFYVPGHKRGQGASAALRDLVGDRPLQADLPELPELDNLLAPQGVIQAAQDLAAQTFGADHTWFLANGSTCGVEAMVLATCRPGDTLIVPRNCHQSVIAALILAGVHPIFVTPEVDPQWGLAHGVTPDAVATALQAHPEAAAVLLVSPTYYGVCSDVAAIAHLTHQHGIPLLVDEAHGAHFGFHPDLPASALSCGADVVVQSTHKVLGALTQAAMLHSQGDRVAPARIQAALALVQSTSPNYLLLASLDAARQQMATAGERLMAQTLGIVREVGDRLQALLQLATLQPTDRSQAGKPLFDPTRLTLDVRGLGLTGFEADDILHNRYRVTCELPSLHSLTFVFTLGNTAAHGQQLVEALEHLIQHHAQPPLDTQTLAVPPVGAIALSPRDAFFAATETIPLAAAPGRIAAEWLCPYPPGIPVLIPGERITPDALYYLQHIHTAGGIITGAADPTLQTLQVIQDKP